MIAEFGFVLALVTLGQAALVERPRNARLASVCPKVDSYWTTFLRDMHNCRGYYKCSNGKPIWQRCPPGLFFHPRLLVCDIPRNTVCRVVHHLEETVPQDEPFANGEQSLDIPENMKELKQFEEIALHDEPYVDEKSVQGVDAAEDEKGLEGLEEPHSQDVNEDLSQALDAPEDDEEQEHLEEANPQVVDGDTELSLNKARPYGARLGWKCPARDGRWPTFLLHVWDCTKYYECSNGRAILQRCPRGLRFNGAKLVCDRKQNVSCWVWVH